MLVVSSVDTFLLFCRDEPEDTLSELQSEAVPDEVRKWLASTFAKQEPPARRAGEERPSFKSVAVAIRTGIFIERIYRRHCASPLTLAGISSHFVTLRFLCNFLQMMSETSSVIEGPTPTHGKFKSHMVHFLPFILL